MGINSWLWALIVLTGTVTVRAQTVCDDTVTVCNDTLAQYCCCNGISACACCVNGVEYCQDATCFFGSPSTTSSISSTSSVTPSESGTGSQSGTTTASRSATSSPSPSPSATGSQGTSASPSSSFSQGPSANLSFSLSSSVSLSGTSSGTPSSFGTPSGSCAAVSAALGDVVSCTNGLFVIDPPNEITQRAVVPGEVHLVGDVTLGTTSELTFPEGAQLQVNGTAVLQGALVVQATEAGQRTIVEAGTLVYGDYNLTVVWTAKAASGCHRYREVKTAQVFAVDLMTKCGKSGGAPWYFILAGTIGGAGLCVLVAVGAGMVAYWRGWCWRLRHYEQPEDRAIRKGIPSLRPRSSGASIGGRV